jgi:hypothetical protein
MNYQVIDNFLDDIDFKELQDSVLYQKNFPWYLSRGVSDIDTDDGYYFTHMFYDNYTINSNHFELIVPIIEKINPKSLIRIKGNFYPRTERIIHHDKHIDDNYFHNGCIFYLNTNNGKTILENNIQIDSIENRLLVFDPSIPHNSTTCTNDHVGRFNINFNYF